MVNRQANHDKEPYAWSGPLFLVSRTPQRGPTFLIVDTVINYSLKYRISMISELTFDCIEKGVRCKL